MREFFDLRPYGLIKMLNDQPIYRQTAAYGHFGREQFPWESGSRRRIAACSSWSKIIELNVYDKNR